MIYPWGTSISVSKELQVYFLDTTAGKENPKDIK